MIDRWSTQIAERIKLSPLAGAWYPSASAGLTAGATSGLTRMPPSASRSANVPATKAFGRRAAASLGYPQAGEHAGRPGIVLAATLAVEPAAGFPILNGRPAPTGSLGLR